LRVAAYRLAPSLNYSTLIYNKLFSAKLGLPCDTDVLSSVACQVTIDMLQDDEYEGLSMCRRSETTFARSRVTSSASLPTTFASTSTAKKESVSRLIHMAAVNKDIIRG
jgi:hypothetical protein